MLTFLPLEQIDEMDKWEGAELNKAKEILAWELTNMVHGEEEANKARESARALFSAGSAENMPSVQIAADAFTDGSIDILGLLVATGLTQTRNEARRAVEQGGVTVNGDKIEDAKTSFAESDFDAEFILRKGKKKFCKVTK
jgi:tyrosyl-tRNA synthetase